MNALNIKISSGEKKNNRKIEFNYTNIFTKANLKKYFSGRENWPKVKLLNTKTNFELDKKMCL